MRGKANPKTAMKVVIFLVPGLNGMCWNPWPALARQSYVPRTY